MQARLLGRTFILAPRARRAVESLQRLKYAFNLSTFSQTETFELRGALWEAITSHFGLLATGQNKQIVLLANTFENI